MVVIPRMFTVGIIYLTYSSIGQDFIVDLFSYELSVYMEGVITVTIMWLLNGVVFLGPLSFSEI